MLTTTQIAAILFILQVFGVSTSTIATVKQDLTATTTPAVSVATPAITSSPTPTMQETTPATTATAAPQSTGVAQAPQAPQFTQEPEATMNADRTAGSLTWTTDIPATAALYIDMQRHDDWTQIEPLQTFTEASTNFTIPLDVRRGVWFYAVIVTANGTSTVHTGQLPSF